MNIESEMKSMNKKWLNWKGFNADVDELPLKKLKGVYVFVAKETFDINLGDFNSEVTGIFCINGEEVKVTVGVPPCNIKEENFRVNKGEIFYVGKAENLRNRIDNHLNGCKINNTVALKLGFASRSYVKSKLIVYYHECKGKRRTELENKIHDENRVVFGK